MIQLGGYAYTDFLQYYMDVMDRYFRKTPPVPSNIYLSQDVIKNKEIKKQIARYCHFPSIINILANDEDEEIRMLARKNEFWNLVGRFQDILGFARTERMTFARIEGFHNLLVILIFEDDLQILAEALNNPAISLKMLVHFIRLLRQRGQGRKDEQILEIAMQVMSQKRKQIVQISQINRASRQLNQDRNLITMLQYLRDENNTIRLAVQNILLREDANTLNRLVHLAILDDGFTSRLDHFVTLSRLLQLLSKTEGLENTSVQILDLPEEIKSGERSRSIKDYFDLLLRSKRIEIIRSLESDLSRFDNIVLLAYCHIDKDINIRKLARKYLNIDDLFSLINDKSTPRYIFRQVLDILMHHEDDFIHQKVHEARMRESYRLKNSLKEMEISVRAYFDIIFQSLGYRRIHEFHDVLHSLNRTERYLSRYHSYFENGKKVHYKNLLNEFQEIRQVFSKKLQEIYSTTDIKTIRELEYIASILDEILQLREMGIQSLRPGTPDDIETEIKFRARIIWQSAISVYLGRIKDLAEMMSKKLLKMAATRDLSERFEQELNEAQQELEQTYKERIQCRLTNACKVCDRRGCAAERFLREARFLIEEFLDIVSEDITPQ
ncbi:MAG TPA: hypothetical protein ENK44_10640 [Caldithrix abyssi]|uniref:Uncharacterized protein n=1 Tax=Caldithrix abyssi TaxID=187145 RepID=A0A7V4UE94_CALAY|nr:hypothetical protein [Caldithrix abyssi]